jgi:hypothetical protein
MNRFDCCAAALLGMLILSWTASSHPQEMPGTSVTTGVAEGTVWLRWDKRTRLGFVRGYLMGIGAGNRGGCFSYDNLSKSSESVTDPTNTPLAHCLKIAPTFSKPPEEYQKEMTEFYRTYPDDRGLNLESLLRQLSDQESKNLRGIDDWFKNRTGKHER